MNVKYYLLCVAAGLACTSVSAADLDFEAGPDFQPQGLADWTGFYAGGFAGFGWSDATATRLQGGTSFSAGHQTSGSADGTAFGLKAGYDLQYNAWVIGAEVDWTSVNASGSKDDISPLGTSVTSTAHFEFQSIYSLTGKIGYTVTPDILVYAEAGAAWADVKYGLTVPAATIVHDETTDTRSGYTVGGGVETRVDANWTLGFEYTYADFDEETYSFANSSSDYDVETDIHLAKLGLNYRLN